MSRCFHRTGSDGSSCENVSRNIVYTDDLGHSYCLLHAPKYYVGAIGFFIGDSSKHSSRSLSFSKDEFDLNIQKLISNQIDNLTIRFDKIFFPENYNYSMSKIDYPVSILQFIGCQNINSISGSKARAIRLSNMKFERLHFHNLEVDEISISVCSVDDKFVLRDSLINTMSIHNSTFDGKVELSKLKKNSKDIYQTNYECSIYLNECDFIGNVEVSDIERLDVYSEFRILYSSFGKDLYFHDNNLKGKLNLQYCRFSSGFAYLENVDVTNAILTPLNLEYLRFSNCTFPNGYDDLENESTNKAEEVYRILKRTALDDKNYQLVSKWHYLEKSMAMHNSQKDNKLIYLFLWCYNLMSGFGEKPSKALKLIVLYFTFVVFILVSLSLCKTGFSYQVDWEYVKAIVLSIKDFVPFFLTPSKESLLTYIGQDIELALIYNILAAFGRLFCVVQLGLLSLAIKNKLQR
ncbi:hypothetical protein VFES401_14935 [Aliivibrio fischeri]|uniref:hypothetical protein n=1 Tax=Aliivibrio fischeri TaxID=668 RepID=UPI00107ECE32|nr:hypothetical protein [Aliivibrio fischeri]TGA68188.1 hypothetical protein VFES401_14935 [Aliivibrio fischeri]